MMARGSTTTRNHGVEMEITTRMETTGAKLNNQNL